ncbi:MAG: NAD(P)/FAD-dependent oxidoreductase [Oligoflexia bacterium]|nr:NAD(P)/FAD-dependent oxidoreductase [Oligoflexia bacterium]
MQAKPAPKSVHTEVLIIGASIAGSSLAAKLSKSGIETLLVDKAEFPRRKACGEGLSCIGTSLLRELGLEPGTPTLPAHALNGYSLWHGDEHVSVPYLLEAERASSANSFGIERYNLDLALLKCAQAHGANFIAGQQVRTITRSGRYFEAQLPQLKILANRLVLADGANSFLAESLAAASHAKPRPRFGYSMMLDGVASRPLNQVHIILQSDAEICCTPVALNRLNVSILMPSGTIRRVLDKDFLAKVLIAVEGRTGFQGHPMGQPLDPRGIGPLNRSRRGGFHNEVFLVGDCCETLDPIGGMGMTHALISSKLAASALIEIIKAGAPIEISGSHYEQTLLKEMRPLRGFTRLTYFYLNFLAGTPLFEPIGHTALLREVGRAAHKNSSRSALAFCSNLLLAISGICL